MSTQHFISHSPQETFNFGKTLAASAQPGMIFLLNGSLGAGKSVLIRGIASGLGIDEEMPSPTFTIVNEYAGKYKLYHFDLYRLNDPYELYEIGFEEYVYADGISFIEWPDKCGELLPEEGVQINIIIKNSKEREITVQWNK